MKKLSLPVSLASLKRGVMSAVAMAIMCVTAFATETPPAFDLTEIMTTATTKIVTDLLAMIAGVLPVTVTLMAASIGIAFAIKFIKKIIAKGN